MADEQAKEFIPLGDRVLIERENTEAKTESGILLPFQATKKMPYGTVINYGAKVTSFQIGDTVLFGEYSGTEIEVNKKRYLIMREEEVIGIIR